MTTPNAAVARHPSRWSSFVDFLAAVRRAEIRQGAPDQRLVFRAAAGAPSQEAAGADGGYAVPPDVRQQIVDAMDQAAPVWRLCQRVSTTSNSIAVPTDPTPAWGATGLQAPPTVEGATGTQSKPALGMRTAKLNKFEVLVPVTDELVEDGGDALSAYFVETAADKLNFRLDDALINGTGVGAPMGVLSMPATQTIAKESGQTAGTVVHLNLSKAWAALYPPSKPRAIWVMSNSAEGQAQELVSPVQAPTLAYGPDGVGRIFGRPVFVSSACQVVGTPGDVVLFDPLSVLVATRPTEVKESFSLHVWFDQGVSAFRFSMRVAMLPLWAATIADKYGSGNLGPAVVVAAR